ncbi:MAG: cytochrome-c peroxidase [Gammaproteobacteria bacterium]|nr:MAG: cytochrome-c peroxidase [Gammaproteobacteria bacterium]
MSPRILPAITLVASVAFAESGPPPWSERYDLPPPMPIPEGNEPTPARIELGRALFLFFDPRLSGPDWISCASCHNPALGWSDGLPVAFGTRPGEPPRATPTLFNVGYATVLMWDGRRRDLEHEALTSRNFEVADVVRRVAAIEGYAPLFEAAYPGEGITRQTIAKAIAAFERSIVSHDTPFDRWQRGEADAVSAAAKRGFALFRGKANCDACHHGYNFTDDGFHNIGLITPERFPQDPGRGKWVPIASQAGAFRTPTLREIGRTAPYMHNGIYATLEEVVEHYDRGGDVHPPRHPNIRPLGLTDREKADLLAFLHSLTTPDHEPFSLPNLPR